MVLSLALPFIRLFMNSKPAARARPGGVLCGSQAAPGLQLACARGALGELGVLALEPRLFHRALSSLEPAHRPAKLRNRLDDDAPLPRGTKTQTGVLPESGLTYYWRKNDEPRDRVELVIAVRAGSIDETTLHTVPIM